MRKAASAAQFIVITELETLNVYLNAINKQVSKPVSLQEWQTASKGKEKVI